MYESFRSEILSELSGSLSQSDMTAVSSALDRVSSRYVIQRQSTDIAVCGRQQFYDIVKTYFAVRFTQGMAKTSMKTQQSILKNFVLAMNVPIADVKPNHVRAYLYEYQTTHSISSRTLQLYRTVICGFLKWAASQEYIPRDITTNIKPIKFVPKPRRALSQLDMQRVRKACKTPRESAIIEALYSTGCRVSQLVNIKLSDIDWQNKVISVIGKGSKHRQVFLNARSQVAIRSYLDCRKNKSPYLISGEKGRPCVSASAIQRIFGLIADRLGIERNSLTPHIIRHTMATQALTGSSVQQVQQMLGHSSIATTMIYAQVDKSGIQAAHRRSII